MNILYNGFLLQAMEFHFRFKQFLFENINEDFKSESEITCLLQLIVIFTLHPVYSKKCICVKYVYFGMYNNNNRIIIYIAITHACQCLTRKVHNAAVRTIEKVVLNPGCHACHQSQPSRLCFESISAAGVLGNVRVHDYY